MSLNMGVKALLNWVNSFTLAHREIEDLQDGELLIRVVYKLKQEPDPPLSQSTEERFKLIAEFVEKDCRFSPTNGTGLSWDNIRNGVNLTVEIAKVLLLLVYYDIMNERCTFKALECEVERELAHLTGSYVMENDGCVYLSKSLDSYLSKRHLPVPPDILERMVSTSTSNASTASSFSDDDDSPVFRRTPKITFLDMHTVASSSVSKSPLQDIMNTPKFQLRKIQRQMVKERDHMDRLEKELASKMSLIAQRESHINQLQYCLEKMKEEHCNQEQTTREQINELQSKNNSLQLRLSEIVKENKDCKSNFSLMERKLDELEEENGVLTSQIRAAHAQLSTIQDEVGRLTETHWSAQEESRTKMDYLHSELNQATAQKELLTEQIQILEGKISCLEDDIRAATKEDVGENLGPIIERDELELEIGRLKKKLACTVDCLKEAEANVEAKTLQLSYFEQEITQQKGLLEQQNLQIEDIVQTKDRISNELQKEISEQRAALQREIDHLKLQLEQAKQQNAEQISELQKHIAASQQELDTLKETSREKEDCLNQAREDVKDLETKFQDLTSILADKNIQIDTLLEEAEYFVTEALKNKNEMDSKDQLLAQICQENANQQEILQNRIQTLILEVEKLTLSVQRAEEEVQVKHDLLARTQQENIEQRALLQQQITTSEMEASRLRKEIEARNEQLSILQKDSSEQSAILQNQNNLLKSQVEGLNTSLTKAEERVQSLQVLLAKQEQESVYQKDVLQQQLTVSEESVRTMKEEIQTKELHITLLNKQFSENSEQLHKDIQRLEGQVESLTSSLKIAEENLQSKESLLANQQSQNTQHIETLQAQIVSSQEEVSRLISELHAKEEHLEGMKDSLHIAKNQVKDKENFIANLEKENTFHIDQLRKDNMDLVEQAEKLKEEIHTKEVQLDLFKVESGKLSEVTRNEMVSLKRQIQSVTASLQTTEEQVQTKVNLLANKEMEISKEREKYQSLMKSSSEEVTLLRDRIQTQEEQLATLREEGSLRSDMLHKEISQLKDQLAMVNKLLSEAEQRFQTQLAMMTAQEQESTQQRELLQQQISVAEAEVKKLNEEIQVRDEHIAQLNATNSEQSDLLRQEIQHLKTQVESLDEFLKKAEEDVKSKSDMLTQQQIEADMKLQEKCHKEEILQKQISSFEKDILELRECHDEKEKLCIEAEEKLEILQAELATVKTQSIEKDHNLDTLKAEVAIQANLAQKAKEETQSTVNMLTKFQEEAPKITNALTLEIEDLKGQLKEIKGKEQQLLETQQESGELIEKLQLQLSASQTEVRKMDVEIQAREEYVRQLNATNSAQSDTLNQEIQHLRKQVECLDASRRKAEEDVRFKNDLLVQQQKESDRNSQENDQKEELLQKQISSFEEEIVKLRECLDERQKLLIRAEENLEILQTELVAVQTQAADKDNSLRVLRAEVSTHVNLAQKANEEAQASAKMLVEQQEENFKHTDALKLDIQVLKGQLEVISLQLKDKEQQLLETQQESAQLTEKLQLQVVSLSADLEQHKKSQTESVKHWEENQENQKAITVEKDALVQENEVLLAKILQAEKDQRALEKQVDVLVLEKERLLQSKMVAEREYLASLRVEQVLKQELELVKLENARLSRETEKNEESDRQKREELQEQLVAKTQAAEHYKAQMEKAFSHYNDKKKLLHESQEEVAELKRCVEVRTQEAKAAGEELKQLQLELEKAQSKEQNMLSKINRLEAQVAFVDLNLRAHNRIVGHDGDVSESAYLDLPASRSNVHSNAKPKRIMSSDSLDQSSLEDSLNNTRKLPAHEDSSTPLVRSSERLAAKRCGLKTESLETLYFTPINARHINRTSTENKIKVDGIHINPSSSVKRRRTTQVINITMTKKTPGDDEGDETFYSLAPARSHPNLSGAHGARPVSVTLFDTPGKMSDAAGDQLSGLPGYRRSTFHLQAPSAFCVDGENEPDGAPDDWMRIAELQARNRACLPHLKSSYPVEFEAGCKSTFPFTDEEVRTGDPMETIRRASVMPGQLQDSVASHRHSLAAGQLGTAVGSRSQRLPLMAGHAPSKPVTSSSSSLSSHLVRSPRCSKRSAASSSSSSVSQTSPEKKLKASCFPRPLTPKNKNGNSGPSFSQLHTSLSPADRRQSVMFTIDNTPQSNGSSLLRKGLIKLRGSTRKSPGKTSKRSPANAVQKKNKSAETSRVAVGRAGRGGSSKSPRVVAKENRDSPQTFKGRTAKSPRLTATARKCVSISEANPPASPTR
ncbi:nuclear mitotic apparatus protein 1 isoform X2 [Syngnathoides biaculeatus]|nr:nuclear mitotic apparatus protein 1 isoform X2 [Syngnathoides biaculeatus]